MITSNSRPNPWLSLFAWLLPTSSLKTWALRKLGNDISDDAIIGPNLVTGCGRFRVGEGTVIGLEGSGGDARAQVRFKRHGEKWLALAVAKLQPQDRMRMPVTGRAAKLSACALANASAPATTVGKAWIAPGSASSP